MSGQRPILRPTARVIVLDPAWRILLFRANIGHSIEPERQPDATSFWALPGGGIEPGETPLAAAQRELREETGLRADGAMPMVAFREVAYSWNERHYLSREHFFFLRTMETALDDSGWHEGDRRWMSDLGWWTLAELGRTGDIVRPPGLAALAERLRQGDVPAIPVRLAGN